MNLLARTFPALVLFLLPGGVSAAATFGADTSGNWFFGVGSGSDVGPGVGCGTGSLCTVATQILYLINYVFVPVLFAVAFLVFLYGVANAYIFSGGDEEARKKGHHLILWGIIAFVVMISLWGLVNVVASTFGLAGYGAPMYPTSY